MSLSREIKYESGINSDYDISPERVFSMLSEVRREVGKLDPSFNNFSLLSVLRIVEDYRYEVEEEEDVKTVVDLSDARRIVAFYRCYSEKGCFSCTSLRESGNIPKQLSYCNIFEPDIEKVKEELGHEFGFSPMVKKHYDVPCDSWTPRFSPKIEELVEMENLIENKT